MKGTGERAGVCKASLHTGICIGRGEGKEDWARTHLRLECSFKSFSQVSGGS